MAESKLTARVETKGAVRAEKELNKIAKTAKVVDINVKKTGKTFKTFGSNAAKAVAAIDGPLGGISSRITAITSLASGGAVAFAGFAAAIVATSFAIVKGVSALDEYDVNLRRVNATIKATGEGVGFTGEALREEAENLALATLTSVDAVQKAQAKLLTFNRVLGEEFTRSIVLAQDLAETGFGSVESNAILLGKALQDPIKGMAALSRVGVTLSETQKQLAQDAVNAGDVFAAQGIILDAVAGQVEGVAKAVAGGTLAGEIDTLGQKWDDLSRNVAASSGALSTWTQIVRGAGRTAGILAEALEGPTSGELFSVALDKAMELSEAESQLEEAVNSRASGYGNLEVKVSRLRREHEELLITLKASTDADNARIKANGEAATKEIEARKRIAAEVKAEADIKAAKEKELEDKKIARSKESAQRELTTLLSLNNSELEAIDAKEAARLEKVKTSRDQELITEQEFQLAKAEIELSAVNAKKAIGDKEVADNLGKTKKLAAQEQALQDTKLGILSGALSAFSAISEKESAASKAAAIASATIQTYLAANNAYRAALEIPGPAGLALAPIAAGAAISAGIMNVRAISSAREQGGSLSAGQASTVAERGQLEILTPASSSRIRTKQQMQQLMGGDSGSSNSINIVNIDQSTGGVSIESSVDDDGRIIQMIRDTTALDATNPNSELRKSFAATTTLEARR